ncbi:MAG: type II toxin-antitoxin system VapC family toxin, partial [Candidatus Brockarchaeota archaeon]|nr:type II toxin-antitoxin system VapC family toxin [Candidatus Brockarchaeota archaeon]
YSKDDVIFNYVRDLLRKAVQRKDLLLVNMIVIDETLWILMKKYRVPLDEALELTDQLMPLLEIIPIDFADYDFMKEAMNNYEMKPSDALHVASMNKAGVKHIISEDGEFDKIPWVKRIWLDTSS